MEINKKALYLTLIGLELKVPSEIVVQYYESVLDEIKFSDCTETD